MLLMLIAPPFLIMGLPPWLIRKAMEKPGVARTARFLTHPVVAFLAYNVTFIGWHFPEMYNWALVSHDLLILQHLMFLAVAVMMWWPVVNPVLELERIPTGPLLMVYVFAFGIPSTVVSAFITLSDSVFYPWYELAPRVTSLSPLDDQRLGGLIMWIPGMLVFWAGISAVFFRWTKDEYQSWGRGKDRRAPPALLILLSVLAPATVGAQDEPPPSVDWEVEAEVGASFFFGATDQNIVSTKLAAERDGEKFELENDFSFLYGEATDDQGSRFVNKRSWRVESNVDYQGFTWINPYFFGEVRYNLEKKIKRRYKGGAGAKISVLDSEVSRLDFALAMLGEKTFEANGGDGGEEFLGRWTGEVNFRRSFSEGRAVLETEVEYNPGFREFDDFTFEAETSLTLQLSEIVRLRLTVEDDYDNKAKDRGALSNNDGRVLFSVLAAF
jgi:hypothetical protein